MFVSDQIGAEFLNWKPGDKIVITTPTGSGKTTFILRSLLPYAIKQNRHIIYICNRKILNDQFALESRKQLERILGTDQLTETEAQKIHVTTYQHCEMERIFPHISIGPNLSGMSRYDRALANVCGTLPQAIHIPPTDILYYVFDEAHYFLSDALFNPDTNYWHGINRSDIISIFLTATPDPLFCFLASKNCAWYDELRIVRQISDRYAERQNLKDTLSNPKILHTTWDEENRCHRPWVDLKAQSEIENLCRTINPYEMAFHFIVHSLDGSMINLPEIHYYSQRTDYAYVYTKYFNKFYDLIDTIVNSMDKWLVFISNEKDGIELTAQLGEKGISAAYLSAQTRHKKDSNGYHEFLNIVERQIFECKVLIATSVIDCGVSIKDPKVKHIVIDQPDQTEFLQMLGRRRVSPSETINLYIKYFSPKMISKLKNNCENNLRFMTNVYRINDEVDELTIENNRTKRIFKLTAAVRNQTVKNLAKGKNSSLIYNRTSTGTATYGAYSEPKYQKSSPDLLKEYQMSTTAFIQILYTLKGYMDALEVYRTEQDPLFYLKEQLSWLCKSYDVQNWVGYTERMQELSDFLEGYRSSTSKITANQQPIFRQECLDHILNLPMPIKAIRKDISRFKNGTTPGMKKLNDVFREIGLPYRIKSKQTASGGRKTAWYVK